MSLLLREVEVRGEVVDVRVDDGGVVAVGRDIAAGDAAVVEGGGGALLPGLWDHHVHVVALAAARHSVALGPPDVVDRLGFVAALTAARPGAPGGWVRGVGYHESVAGPLDRHDLDRVLADVPVRLQHRSGAMWVLNSAAIDRLDLEHLAVDSLERDADGRLTGRLYGVDRWLGERLRHTDPRSPPDLAAIGRELAGYGVVGVTDATPYETLAELDLLADSVADGRLPLHVTATGGPALAAADLPAPLGRGPVKLWLADHALPSLDELCSWIAGAHGAGRPVAVHCVTRSTLALVVAALDDVGSVSGDRIEHGAVVPPDMVEPLRRHGVTVVTQPNFVAERGDRYLTEVDSEDRPHLYPCRSLLDAGVAVGGSTDAPFGHPDPWRAIAAAVDRRTAGGTFLGPEEAVTAQRALDLFLSHPRAPGGPPRRVATGEPADLVLLDGPLDEVLRSPDAGHVRLTVVAGHVTHP